VATGHIAVIKAIIRTHACTLFTAVFPGLPR